MKKLVLLAVLLFSTSLFAQYEGYNLKELPGVYVSVQDPQNILNDITVQKFISDTRLKLLSAGIKTSVKENPELVFRTTYIKSALAEERIITQIFLVEDVKVIRDKKEVSTKAQTYSEGSFFTAPLAQMPKAVIDNFENLFVHFIDKYLKDNTK